MMTDDQKNNLLNRELRVKLVRETLNWSDLDKKIIPFVKKHPVFYDGDRITWKKRNYQDILNYLWNKFLKKSNEQVNISVLNHRWMVIKNLYLNFYAKKINLDSKFFDGSLAFLNPLVESKLRQTSGYGKHKGFAEAQLQPGSITSPSPPSDMEIPLAEHKSRQASNLQHSNKVGLNKTEIIEPKLTAPSPLLNMEVYKPGSLVSGTILEIDFEEENLSEADALNMYQYNFCSDVRDEELLVKTNITTSTTSDMHVSSNSPTVSVEEALIMLNEENKNACEESITLYTVNANNDETSTFVPVAPEELEQVTSSVDFRNPKLLVPPNADTRTFFKGIGKYVANNFDEQKQNETRLEVWSLVTAAELELLDDD